MCDSRVVDDSSIHASLSEKIQETLEDEIVKDALAKVCGAVMCMHFEPAVETVFARFRTGR